MTSQARVAFMLDNGVLLSEFNTVVCIYKKSLNTYMLKYIRNLDTPPSLHFIFCSILITSIRQSGESSFDSANGINLQEKEKLTNYNYK